LIHPGRAESPDAAPPSRRRRHRIAASRPQAGRSPVGATQVQAARPLFGRNLNGQHHTSHRSDHRGYRSRRRLVRPGTLVLSKSRRLQTLAASRGGGSPTWLPGGAFVAGHNDGLHQGRECGVGSAQEGRAVPYTSRFERGKAPGIGHRGLPRQCVPGSRLYRPWTDASD
jgi:hypothetical protein